ncbi:MAG: hypothetical protein ACI8RA_002104 [Chlamydiales bacterium]|jgi:hypothetical protein
MNPINNSNSHERASNHEDKCTCGFHHSSDILDIALQSITNVFTSISSLALQEKTIEELVTITERCREETARLQGRSREYQTKRRLQKKLADLKANKAPLSESKFQPPTEKSRTKKNKKKRGRTTSVASSSSSETSLSQTKAKTSIKVNLESFRNDEEYNRVYSLFQSQI